MEKDQVFQTFLDTLNEAVKADRDAMQELSEFRVPCNEEMANHPTIQVSGNGDWDVVGMLGIINGICERLTGKRVAGDFDESGNLLGFVPYVEG